MTYTPPIHLKSTRDFVNRFNGELYQFEIWDVHYCALECLGIISFKAQIENQRPQQPVLFYRELCLIWKLHSSFQRCSRAWKGVDGVRSLLCMKWSVIYVLCTCVTLVCDHADAWRPRTSYGVNPLLPLSLGLHICHPYKLVYIKLNEADAIWIYKECLTSSDVSPCPCP